MRYPSALVNNCIASLGRSQLVNRIDYPQPPSTRRHPPRPPAVFLACRDVCAGVRSHSAKRSLAGLLIFITAT